MSSDSKLRLTPFSRLSGKFTSSGMETFQNHCRDGVTHVSRWRRVEAGRTLYVGVRQELAFDLLLWIGRIVPGPSGDTRPEPVVYGSTRMWPVLETLAVQAVE